MFVKIIECFSPQNIYKYWQFVLKIIKDVKVIWLPNECVFWEIPLNSIPWETKVKINKWCLKIVYLEKKDLEIKISYFAFGLFLWLSVRFLRHFWKPFLGIWISSFTLTIFLLETRRTSQFETPFQSSADDDDYNDNSNNNDDIDNRYHSS